MISTRHTRAAKDRSLIDDRWHAPILFILGLMIAWNTLTAWFGVQPRLNSYPTELQLRAGHFRIFLPALGYALLTLWLGMGRARRGGSVAVYGMSAVATMLVAAAVLFTTFGIRTIG